MINKLKPKSEFSRNVLTLMTGTTIAQAIPIAIGPILTRLYTPEDFGMFALYASITSIVAIVATGRYELAIMLPKKEIDAINVMVLSMGIVTIISFITFLIVSIFNTQITDLLGNDEISGWLYLMPFSIFVLGIYTNLNYWNNRKKQYKTLALNRVYQSSTTATSNLLLGWSKTGSGGLIVGTLFGQVLAATILFKKTLNENHLLLNHINKLKIYSLSKKYIKFPRFDILASLSGIAAQQVPNILFNMFFNAATAGHYFLTQKMLGLPVTIMASAILDVFKEQASKDFQKYGNAKQIYIATFKKLFIMSFIPSVLVFLFAVDLFGFVFGEAWKISGEYAQILTPMLFLRFISSPLSFMFYIGEKQNLNLYLQLGLLTLIFGSFYLGENAKDIVKYISLSFSLFYIAQLIISSKIAGVYKIK